MDLCRTPHASGSGRRSRSASHCSSACSSPPQPATTLLEQGPFRLSRNPLYVGLIVLDVAIALITPSAWALFLAPVGVAALWWGAVLPEERYLLAKFGAEYEAYLSRVRRWL